MGYHGPKHILFSYRRKGSPPVVIYRNKIGQVVVAQLIGEFGYFTHSLPKFRNVDELTTFLKRAIERLEGKGHEG